MTQIEKYPLLKKLFNDEDPINFICILMELEKEVSDIKSDKLMKESLRFILNQEKNKTGICLSDLPEKIGIKKWVLAKLYPIGSNRKLEINFESILKIYSMDNRHLDTSIFKEEFFNKILNQ